MIRPPYEEQMSLDDEPQLYTRSFALAFASQCCFNIANVLLAHYARWVEFLGGNIRDVGWIMGSGAIVALLLRPLSGSFIDRLGARKIWFTGIVIYTCGLLPNIWLHDVGPMIYILRVLFLVGCGLVYTSSLTYITQTTPAHRRTESIAVFGASGLLGISFAPLLGDLILGAGERSRDNFLLLFCVASVGIGLSCLFLWFLPAARRNGSPVKVGYLAFVRAARRYWPGPVSVVSFMFYMTLSVPFIFLASYIDQSQLRGTEISSFGLFFCAYGGWGLVVRLGLRQLPDRIGRRKVLLAGLALTAAGMFCFLAVDVQRLWPLLLLGMLCGSGHAICVPTISALMLEPFPYDVRGMGSTLTIMISDMAMVVGAPMLGMVAATFGYEYLFIMSGLVALAATVYFCWMTAPIWHERKKKSNRQVVATLERSQPDKKAPPMYRDSAGGKLLATGTVEFPA